MLFPGCTCCGASSFVCTNCSTGFAPTQVQVDIANCGSLNGTYILSHGASACFTSNTGCEYSLTGISSCNGNTICLYFNFTFSSPNYVSSLYIGCYGGFYVAYVTFEKSHGTSPPDCMTLSGLTGFTNLGPATHVCNDGGDLCDASAATITVTAIP